jgi:membrane associated rhomboid family serine protease
MGETRRSRVTYNTQQLPFGYALTPWVKRLLVANTVVFVLTLLPGADPIFRWFAFAPSRVLIQPWSAVTYMFLHGSFWHLFINMLVLFFFGPPLENKWGSREFVKYYLICGLGGAALSFLFVPFWIVGASAATFGLMLAFALNWPNAPIYFMGVFPVKAKWLVGFFFFANLFSAFDPDSGSGIAHFAHLGGVIAGFIYLKSGRIPLGLGKKDGGRRRARRFAIVREEAPGRESGQEKQGRPEWSSEDEAMLDRVDKILDKISAEGMSSLTPEERRVLDEVSKKHRAN